MTRLAERARDAGQMDLFMLATMTPPPELEPEPEPQPKPQEEAPLSVGEQFFRHRCAGREVVEVDHKRLDWDTGDIAASYSADMLANHRGSGIRRPFKFRGDDWVSIGGGSTYRECYRVVPLDRFDGPSAPYAKHGFNSGETREEFGGYHGMSAIQGSREMVLQGPPIIFVAGQPEQSALL